MARHPCYASALAGGRVSPFSAHGRSSTTPRQTAPRPGGCNNGAHPQGAGGQNERKLGTGRRDGAPEREETPRATAPVRGPGPSGSAQVAARPPRPSRRVDRARAFSFPWRSTRADSGDDPGGPSGYARSPSSSGMRPSATRCPWSTRGRPSVPRTIGRTDSLVRGSAGPPTARDATRMRWPRHRANVRVFR